MNYLLFAGAGYLSGSILYGYWLPRWLKGIDVRALGDDGNPGTANAFKHGGIGIGILTVVFELLKGIVPVYFGARYLNTENPLFIAVIVAPVLGHALPLFSKGKGGKSIAVSFGVLLGFFPNLEFALTLAFFYLFFSLLVVVEPHFYRSICTFVCFSAARILFGSGLTMNISCGLISLIVILKHLEKFQKQKLRVYFGFWNKSPMKERMEEQL